MWRRYKLLVTAIFFGLAIPALALLHYTSRPAYVSQATIAVEPSLLDQMPQFREFARRESVATLLVLLKSRSFGEAVVEALPKEGFEELIANPQYTDYVLALKNKVKLWLGIPPTVYSPQERAVAELQNARMTFIQSPQLSTILTLAGSASRPRVSMDLVNSYLQVLLTQTRTASQQEARGGREFLEDQLQRAKETLIKAEENLAKYQQQRGRTTLGGQTELDMDRLSQAETALVEAEASRDVMWAQMAVLRQSLERADDKSSKGSAQDPGTQRNEVAEVLPAESVARLNAFKAAQAQLERMEEKLAALRERYTEAHPLVQATQQEVVNGRARVAQLARDLPITPMARETQGPRPIPALLSDRAEVERKLASLKIEESGLQAKIVKLKMQVDWQRKNLRSLSQEAVDLGNLRRTVEVNRILVAALTDKLMASRVHEQGQDRVVRILVPASFPSRPTQSDTLKYGLVMLVLAGSFAFGAAFGVEFWRQPVETEEDVRKATALPVLGSVGVMQSPLVDGKTKGDRRAFRLLINLSASPNRARVHIEVYRAIRASLETQRLQSSFRSILVNSPGPGEGKSTTVLNLAYVFQELGRRVLVVDADLRRPTIHRVLTTGNTPGLVDFLSYAASFEQVCRPLASGITLIPGQVARGDAGSLLASSRIRQLLDMAATQFDLVFLDSAPILAVPDNLLLAPALDRVILVVRASATSKRDLQKAQAILQKVNARILGIVVNQANRRDVHYYHPRYRRYYSYGDGKGGTKVPRKSGSSLVAGER